MAVLVLEAGVGALARLYEEQVGPELKMNLNRTFLENYSVRSRETAAIDQMQKEVSTRLYIEREKFPSHFLSRPIYIYTHTHAGLRPKSRRRTIANKIGRAPTGIPISRIPAYALAVSISSLVVIFIPVASLCAADPK